MHRKQTNQRWISDSQIIYDGALCDNIMSGGHFIMIKSSNLHGEGIVELPLHAIIFSIHDKLKGWRRTKTPMTQEFHILVPSFFSRCEEYNLLLALLRNCCFWWINLYSSVSTKCYLNQYPYFGNNRISCKDVQSPEFVISKHEIFSTTKFDSKNCVSNHQGRWWLISKMQRHMQRRPC